MGDLACQALDLQLKLHHESQLDSTERSNLQSAPTSSLFHISARSAVESLMNSANQDTDLQAIYSLPRAVSSRAFGERFERLSYVTVSRSSRSTLESTGQHCTTLQGIDIDEWYVHTMHLIICIELNARHQGSCTTSHICVQRRVVLGGKRFCCTRCD